MIQNIASFMPSFIYKRQWAETSDYKLNSSDVALILAIFSVAQIMFAPFNANIKNTLGSKNAIIFGFTEVTLSTFGLGYIANIDDPIRFKNAALILRFLQG